MATLKQMAALVAVADTKGYQAAADKIYATKEGVYFAVRTISEELGIRLIQPKSGGSRKPLTLTPAAEHLVQNYRNILDCAEFTSNLISKVYDKDGNVNYGSSELVKKTQPGFDNEAASYASI